MDDDEEESCFVEYGTPLDIPDDDDWIPSKKLRSDDQFVRDKYGRRRFHGAFTGGFSAGFFNSVGSLEGWTPSSFKSSRSEKAESKQQRPQDFMDEEDLSEFGISPQVLQPTADYSEIDDNILRKRKFQNDGIIPGKPALEVSLPLLRKSIGVKLLKKIGWKPGQGVGPRVNKKEKKLQEKDLIKSGKRIYGCSLPEKHTSAPEDSSDEEEFYNKITFAPHDYEPFFCNPKKDTFGIGYQGLDKRPILSSHINLFEPSLVIEEKHKKVAISGHAFGVGALEEEDEDIYAVDDMSQYDFSLGNKSLQKEKMNKQAHSQNNSGILPGFVQATVTTLQIHYFAPPELPVDFNPIHEPRKTRFSAATMTIENIDNARRKGLSRHNLTSVDRQVILDNSSAHTSTSISTTICLENQALKSEAFKITLSMKPPEKITNKLFVSDSDKQKRFETYLELSKSGRECQISSLQPLHMTEWEKKQEIKEFASVTSFMNNSNERFVSAELPDDAPNPDIKSQREYGTAEQRQAAEAGLFGVMTREVLPWSPCKKLLERFNIADVSPSNSKQTISTKRQSRPTVFGYLSSMELNKIQAVKSSVEETLHINEENKDTLENQNKLEVENKDLEAENYNEEEKKFDEKLADPPTRVDIFKAIFVSDSEDSQSDSDDENLTRAESEECIQSSSNTDTKEETEYVQPISDDFKSNNETLDKSSTKMHGVFANLNLDVINKQIATKGQSKLTAQRTSEVSEINEPSFSGDCLMYGPMPPVARPLTSMSNDVRVTPKPVFIKSVICTSNEVWVEKKHKEKKKKSKLSKHKKHKHKVKKSKR